MNIQQLLTLVGLFLALITLIITALSISQPVPLGVPSKDRQILRSLKNLYFNITICLMAGFLVSLGLNTLGWVVGLQIPIEITLPMAIVSSLIVFFGTAFRAFRVFKTNDLFLTTNPFWPQEITVRQLRSIGINGENAITRHHKYPTGFHILNIFEKPAGPVIKTETTKRLEFNMGRKMKDDVIPDDGISVVLSFKINRSRSDIWLSQGDTEDERSKEVRVEIENALRSLITEKLGEETYDGFVNRVYKIGNEITNEFLEHDDCLERRLGIRIVKLTFGGAKMSEDSRNAHITSSTAKKYSAIARQMMADSCTKPGDLSTATITFPEAYENALASSDEAIQKQFRGRVTGLEGFKGIVIPGLEGDDKKKKGGKK